MRFLPLDITDEESVNDILMQIDMSLQYGEDQEPREPKVLLLLFIHTVSHVISPMILTKWGEYLAEA